MKPKKRHKLLLAHKLDISVAHFVNAAARAACGDKAKSYEKDGKTVQIRHAGHLTIAVDEGHIPATAVQRANIKVMTWRDTEDPPYVQKPQNVMGVRPDVVAVRSDRSLKKEKTRQELKARIVLDRLLKQWPERAVEARENERMANWFVAAAEWELEDADREQLAMLVKDGNLGRIDPKYQHRWARVRDGIERVLKEAA